MTPLPANPFLSAAVPPAETPDAGEASHNYGEREPAVMLACSSGVTAAASPDPQSGAAAISFPHDDGGAQEAPAPDALNPHESAGALETDCIGEIFIGAAMFVSRFIPDMHAIVDAMEYENAPRAEYGAPTWDDMPLFLQRAAG